MNKNKYQQFALLSLLMIQFLLSKGQEQATSGACNRQSVVKSYIKKLPSSFCLPKGSILYKTHNSQDIDGDGVGEVIVEYLREELSDGDTILTGIFKMQSDNSYSLIKVFDNLEFPYYPDFNYNYFKNKLEQTGDQFLYNEYPGLYGLTNDVHYNLKFDGSIVKISLKPGVGEYYYQEYEYNKNLNDWLLTKSTYQDEYAGNNRLQILEIPIPVPTLSNFSLLDYL